ncbi:hypothetical protein BCR34DRAFT_267381 [Clohesyomyces aquaticus]|uniref:Uncharacterized protein n=1 Tax=Clohesyomyces aquaticus TaxID=1231657 RepID=A0A1Y1ZT41_9PLEO|nr:hypothetical protein BCR34DRAFT_267381 [Clohesyomyces aquaticus]
MAENEAKPTTANTTSRRGSAQSHTRRRSSAQFRRMSRSGSFFNDFGFGVDDLFNDTNLGSLWDENADAFQQYAYGDPHQATQGHGEDPYYAKPETPLPNGVVSNDATSMQSYAQRASIGMTNQPFVALPNTGLEGPFLQNQWDAPLGGSQELFSDTQLTGQQYYMNEQFICQAHQADIYNPGYSGAFDGYHPLSVPEYHDVDATIPFCPPPSRKRNRSDSRDGEGSEHPQKKIRRDSSDSKPKSDAESRRTSDSLGNVSAVQKEEIRKNRMMQHRVGSAIAPYRKGEKPKVDKEKSWVRVNNTTAGKTTRTSKINNYKPSYENRPHPLGLGWNGPNHRFEYTEAGEFKEATLTAKQVKEFILHYPRNEPKAKLKLWIQKCPTDSARRYKSTTWSKCRFRDCPAQVYQTGSIVHGHYRVAFDEKWHWHRENADPFLTTGYAHLYCMERFLDFPEICRKADVQADTRAMTNEPRGNFAGTLQGAPELGIALAFIEACQQKTLRQVQEFKNYPRHEDYKQGAPKDHNNTLTYYMTRIKAQNRPPAQIKQFMDRGISQTHLIANMGNLDKLFAVVNAKKEERKAEKRKRKDRADPENKARDNEGMRPRATGSATPTLDFTPRQPQKKSRSPPKRQIYDDDQEELDPRLWAANDSDEEGIAPYSAVQPAQPSSLRSRASTRLQNVPPVNYNLDHILGMEPASSNSFQSFQPQENIDPQSQNTGSIYDDDLADIAAFNAQYGLPGYNPDDHKDEIFKDLGLDFQLQRRRSSAPSQKSSVSVSRRSSLRRPSVMKKESISSGSSGEPSRRKSVQWKDQVRQTRSAPEMGTRHSERLAWKKSVGAENPDDTIAGRVAKRRKTSI